MLSAFLERLLGELHILPEPQQLGLPLTCSSADPLVDAQTGLALEALAVAQVLGSITGSSTRLLCTSPTPARPRLARHSSRSLTIAGWNDLPTEIKEMVVNMVDDYVDVRSGRAGSGSEELKALLGLSAMDRELHALAAPIL